MVKWWAFFYFAGIINTDSEISITFLCVIPILLFTGYVFANREGCLPTGLSCKTFRLGNIERFCLISVTSVIIFSTASYHSISIKHDKRTGRISRELRTSSSGASDLRGCKGRIRKLITRNRDYLLRRITQGPLENEASSLLKSVLLADRSDLPPKFRDDYRYLGISHYLALSGLHLGLIVIPVSLILFSVPIPPRMREFIILIFVVSYTVIAGAPSSLSRAASLYISVIFSRALNLNEDIFSSLLTGSFFLVSACPAIAFDAGFRLSFLAVCGISILALPLIKRVNNNSRKTPLGALSRFFLSTLIVTLSVNLYTMPLVLELFGRYSPVAPIANLVMIVPFTLFIYAGGLYIVSPAYFIRAAVSYPVNHLSSVLYRIPGYLADWYYPQLLLTDIEIRSLYFSLFLLSLGIRSRGRFRTAYFISAFLLGFYSISIPIVSGRPQEKNDKFAGTISEEGLQGKIVSFEKSFGGVLTLKSGINIWEAKKVHEKINREGIRKVDIIIIISPGIYPATGVVYLIKRLGVKRLLCSRYAFLKDSGTLLRMGVSAGIIEALGEGSSFTHGDMTLDFISPPFPLPEGHKAQEDSLILRFRRSERI